MPPMTVTQPPEVPDPTPLAMEDRQVAAFLAMLALVRILEPEDFGLVALAWARIEVAGRDKEGVERRLRCDRCVRYLRLQGRLLAVPA
jgi:hypothetical protein